jgi:hypothetical protein
MRSSCGEERETVRVSLDVDRLMWERFAVSARRRHQSRNGLLRSVIERTARSAVPGPYAAEPLPEAVPGLEEREQRV